MRIRRTAALAAIAVAALSLAVIEGRAEAAPPAPSGCLAATDAAGSGAGAQDITGVWLDVVRRSDGLHVVGSITLRSLPATPIQTVPVGKVSASWELRFVNNLNRTNTTLAAPYMKASVNFLGGVIFESGYVVNGTPVMWTTSSGEIGDAASPSIFIDQQVDGLSISEDAFLTDVVATASTTDVLTTTTHDRVPDAGASDAVIYARDDASHPAPHPCVDESTWPTQAAALSADGFVDSIGVNTHLNFAPSNYRSATGLSDDAWPAVEAALQTAGIRHVRDAFPTDVSNTYFAQVRDLRAKAGVRLDLITPVPPDPSDAGPIVQALLTLVRTAPAAGSAVFAIETPNETDNPQAMPAAQVKQYQQALYTAIRAEPDLAGVAVLGPSLATKQGYDAYAPAPAGVGDVAAAVDFGNIHVYATSEPYTRTQWLDVHKAREQIVAPAKPVQITETGYSQDGVYVLSEATAGSYIPKTLLTGYASDVPRTYLYELLDEAPILQSDQGHFGILRSDFTPKPAYTAIKNMITLLSDPCVGCAPQTLGSLGYSVTGTKIRHVLLQKRDGTFLLALWQDARLADPLRGGDLCPGADCPPSTTAAIGFTSSRGATEYRIGQSTTPTATYPSSSSLRVAIPPDDVVLLKIT